MSLPELAGTPTREGIEGELQFEQLLADIAARFTNVPSSEVDDEVIDAQRRLVDFLQVDRSSLWQLDGREPPRLTLTHFHGELGQPTFPQDPNTTDLFPWVTSEAVAGRTVAVRDMELLPAEAVRDRESWDYFGRVKSVLVVPLSTGGGPVIGLLAFDALKRQCDWPGRLTTRCELIARVFANALARKKADQLLRASEERYRTIAQNLPGVVYQFCARSDGHWGLSYVDVRAEEVCGLPAEPVDTFWERFLACVAPEERDAWLRSIDDAIRNGREWENEFRFLKPCGEEMYLRAIARPRPMPGRLVFNGVFRDITVEKRNSNTLCNSQTTLRAVIDSTDDLIWSVDNVNFGLLAFNGPLRDYFREQRTISIVEGMRPADLLPTPELAERWCEFYQRALREGPYTTEYRTVAQTRILQLSLGILESGGAIFGVSVFGKDVTLRVRAEEELRQTLEELHRVKDQLQHENQYLRGEVQTYQGEMPIVGNSDPLRRVITQARQVALTDSTILILGETGTGKELLASYLHRIGKRSNKPLIVSNIAAIPAHYWRANFLVANEAHTRAR